MPVKFQVCGSQRRAIIKDVIGSHGPDLGYARGQGTGLSRVGVYALLTALTRRLVRGRASLLNSSVDAGFTVSNKSCLT